MYPDRFHAGRALGKLLAPRYRGRTDVLVLALPRGGVPVGYEVADVLKAELDVFVVRKLGVPGHEELAMGALASGGTRVLNQGVTAALDISPDVIDGVSEQAAREIARRERAYRGARPPAAIEGRVAILTDDGLATGATMRAAVLAVRRRDPRSIVVAVPVGAASTCEELAEIADEVVCADMPEFFYSVGSWYEDFSQTTDQEVRRLLDLASRRPRLVA